MKRRLRQAAVGLLAVSYILAGANHFVSPEFYLAIMPPYLPAPGALVFWSGVAEVLLGLAVIPRATRRWAGWGIVALLVAVFPANVHMALHPSDFADLGPTWMLYLRLPVQIVFGVWAVWATRWPADVDGTDRA